MDTGVGRMIPVLCGVCHRPTGNFRREDQPIITPEYHPACLNGPPRRMGTTPFTITHGDGEEYPHAVCTHCGNTQFSARAEARLSVSNDPEPIPLGLEYLDAENVQVTCDNCGTLYEGGWEWV